MSLEARRRLIYLFLQWRNIHLKNGHLKEGNTFRRRASWQRPGGRLSVAGEEEKTGKGGGKRDKGKGGRGARGSVEAGRGGNIKYPCWLSVISCRSSVVSYQSSVISRRLSVVSYRLSVIGCQLSVVSYRLSVIGCQLSVVSQ
jgi:hypothetical protein